MKKSTTNKIVAVLTALFLFPAVAFTQIEGDFLKGGINDGMKLIEAYMTPWAKAFGAGFSGGWYNTAKPHKLGGFDITVTVSAGMVPEGETSFDLADIDFENLTLVNPGGPTIAPTIAGMSSSGPALHSVIESGPYSIEVANFDSPSGTGVKFVPVPMAQVGIGLPLGTELTGRFIPKLTIRDGDISMWGIGLKHSIMQYIPGNSLLPFDVSLFGGFTKMNGNLPIDVQPDSYTNYSTYTFTDFADQMVSASVMGWNASVIASLNIPILTVYGGLGYASSRTTIDIVGNIPMPVADPTISTTEPAYKDSGVLTDIEGIDIQDFSGLRANLGFRVKFAVFTIHADYTRSQYNVFTTGIGVSFR
ncbi:MAG: hypothetical protein IH591_01890 [Bacteroidales bacterium]|nr:hypothetical protein [Bacteroidales bacterium]